MKKILVVLSLCVLFSLSGTISNNNIGQRDRKLILKTKLQPANKNFFGILLVPYIICFFAATGIWPHFPQHMQSSVNEMGQQIFSQSDDHIRNFCKGKFLLNSQAYKPVFFKGFFFPFLKDETFDTFRPIDEWTPKSTVPTKTTMPTKVTPMPAETKVTQATTLPPTVVTREETTVPDTTTPDVSVVTFDPSQPITSICNCSQPKLLKKLVNVTSIEVEKNVSTSSTRSRNSTPPTHIEISSSSATPPTHIKIDVKSVISFIDSFLSYFNLTGSNQ